MNNKNNGVMRIAKSRAEARSRRTGARLDAGFGTMDVLIAVLIMGVLSAITITALGGMLTKARVASCQSDGQTISTAIDAWNAENPGVLATAAGLTGNTLGGPYLQSFPTGTTSYTYTITGGVLQLAINGGQPVAFTDASQCSTIN